MVYIIHHISFYIVNEYNVFDIHVNMVDNSKHKVLCKPEYNKENICIYLFNKLTCEQINSRPHFCSHGTCNCPVRQRPHVPGHLCLQASIVSQSVGQEYRFNSDGDETIRHGTLTA